MHRSSTMASSHLGGAAFSFTAKTLFSRITDHSFFFAGRTCQTYAERERERPPIERIAEHLSSGFIWPNALSGFCHHSTLCFSHQEIGAGYATVVG